MDDWYTDAEQSAIDTAGVRDADTMRKLRAYDAQPDFPFDAWPSQAARGPDYTPTEGAT